MDSVTNIFLKLQMGKTIFTKTYHLTGNFYHLKVLTFHISHHLERSIKESSLHYVFYNRFVKASTLIGEMLAFNKYTKYTNI